MAIQPKPASVPRLRVIPEDETFSRKVEINETAKTATATYAVKAGENAKNRYEVNTVFDFSGCSVSELIGMAADSAIIKWQSNWRKTALSKVPAEADKAYDASNWKRVDVKVDILSADKSRGPVDPVRAALSAIGKMSPEQMAAFLKEAALKK